MFSNSNKNSKNVCIRSNYYLHALNVMWRSNFTTDCTQLSEMWQSLRTERAHKNVSAVSGFLRRRHNKFRRREQIDISFYSKFYLLLVRISGHFSQIMHITKRRNRPLNSFNLAQYKFWVYGHPASTVYLINPLFLTYSHSNIVMILLSILVQ